MVEPACYGMIQILKCQYPLIKWVYRPLVAYSIKNKRYLYCNIYFLGESKNFLLSTPLSVLFQCHRTSSKKFLFSIELFSMS